MGFQVLYGPDPSQLLKVVYAVQPHLIVLEVRADWSPLQRLRDVSNVPVIGLCGCREGHAHRALLEPGCYLYDAFTADELVARVGLLAPHPHETDQSRIRLEAARSLAVLSLPRPLKHLTPADIVQIDRLVSQMPGSGEIRLMKAGGRLRLIGAIERLDSPP
jgi:DNA-binding response OmpR family regulator